MRDKTPSQRAQDWLSGFENALSQGQTAQATALFDTDCYWRDLVSFTWNICTQEGQSAIEAMLQARLADVQPRRRAGEVQLLGHGDEVAQMSQLH